MGPAVEGACLRGGRGPSRQKQLPAASALSRTSASLRGGRSMGEERAAEEAAAAAATAVSLRVVAAAAWHVIRGRRFWDFPRVLTFLESVAEAAPELVPFQHLAKLRLGLQAKIVMNLLQEDQPQGKIYDAVDSYFPENETPPSHAKATAQDLKMVRTAQENFRILVLRLLGDCIEREIYVQEYLETDYGEAFVKVVEELFCDYLCQLEHVLPEPQIQQLLEAASLQTPHQLPQPSATILNQYFAAVGYQPAGCAEPPSTPPHPSSAPRQSEDEDPPSSPLSPQPGRSRREDSPSCVSEGELHRPSSINSETADDLVPDSESERSTSPFQGEYQATRHRTLIPTFQEHLRDSSSPLNSSPL
ncbi:TERF1-interacting nuclear factor 2 [Protobothrops mucrosquamatus]|uniref:TERF1-interacting nuclear factor 2 n=1 Tax=Protobothrops mucrosquamatus TaxID=103944 RepID=UPI0010FB22D9|nr:TERF1-interacting nuclear factor 2 [Protobothrops mucrosquamatus]